MASSVMCRTDVCSIPRLWKWFGVKSTTTADCYDALEKKAALYEKLGAVARLTVFRRLESVAFGDPSARGEVDDTDVYNVDFVRKGYLEDDQPSSASRYDDDDGNRHGTGGMMSADMEVRLRQQPTRVSFASSQAGVLRAPSPLLARGVCEIFYTTTGWSTDLYTLGGSLGWGQMQRERESWEAEVEAAHRAELGGQTHI
eukprot:1098316-Prorocentrum_minimum.AAC.2